MTENKEQTVTINDVPYKLADLSDNAKALLQSIHVMDQELERAQQQQR